MLYHNNYFVVRISLPRWISVPRAPLQIQQDKRNRVFPAAEKDLRRTVALAHA